MGTMLLARKRRYRMHELRHPSPMPGVLTDDVMQGGLWATCTSLPKRAGFGWVEKKKEVVTMCDHPGNAAYL